MKTKIVTLGIICVLVLSGFLGIVIFENDNASVFATNIYVGGTGGGNYSKIQDAIDAANSGDTIYVYNGTYYENIVIDQEISLIGNGTNNTIIDGQANSNVIRVIKNNVTIKGFTVKNSGTGSMDTGIKLNNAQNCLISNNNISNNCIGIYISGGSDNKIKSNNMSSNNRTGIRISYSDNNNISNNNIENNGNGTFLPIQIPFQIGGITILESNNNLFSYNILTNNNHSSIRLWISKENKILFNKIQDHDYGIYWNWSGSKNNIIYLNNFINNINNIGGSNSYQSYNSTQIISYIYNDTNFIRYLGNYWDNYIGKDLDGDGIGDTTYSVNSNQDLYPLIKPIENYIIIPTSTKVEMNATSSNSTNVTVSLVLHEATLNASVKGDLNGTINFTDLEIIIINSSYFAGFGFFSANWTGNIEGKAYNGSWQGMLFNNSGERKIYLKGTVFGGLFGISDGYFIESINGSGNYDLYNSTWTISYICSELVFAKLTLNGTINYQNSKDNTSEIYILQSSFSGNATGYYNGSLDIILTHVRINNKTNQYYGSGFSIIGYVSTFGSGTGWTYDRTISKNITKLKGWFTEPLWAMAFGTLVESGSTNSLAISLLRIDIGLPPRAIIKVFVWGPWQVSPGQTINYLLEYQNNGLKAANNTKIILTLPKNTTYKSNTGSGIYNSTTHEVTWRRNISAKSRTLVSVKCKVKWGLPWGTKLTCIGYIQDFVKNITLVSDSFTSRVFPAYDPNIKYGPEGNVTPGQKLNYTLEYENEGSGIAFGVYFTDELSENLNDSTLEIGPVISTNNGSILAPTGIYNPETRTIIWFVGEVGPGEGGYANITINVRDDAIHNTEVINYGTVYFPSVPEITRTNGIVSVVRINQGPIAFAGSNIVVYTLQNIIFDGSGSYDPDGFIINYTWDFGDSEIGYGKDIAHTYLDDGKYLVNLTVRDDWGFIAFHEIYVTVQNRLPEAKLEVDFATVKTNEQVTFNATNSSDLDGTVSDYYFDFGDGSNSGWVQTSTISHQYSDGTKTYTAKLSVRDDDSAISTNIAGIKIKVNNRLPIPKLTVNPIEAYTYEDIMCNAELSTDLDGEISSYYFDFGDEINSGWITTPSISHQYSDGTKKYTISLKVIDDDGVVSTDIPTTEITIKNRKPVPSLIVENLDIYVLDEVILDASGSYDLDGGELEYYFDFGDGTSSNWITNSVIRHTYTKGTQDYSIELIIKDSDSETNTTDFLITVINRVPHADAGLDQNVEVNQIVNFDGSRSFDPDGNILSYNWDFGEGTTSGWLNTAKTTHSYNKPGDYTITLTVSDGSLTNIDTCIIQVSTIEKAIPIIKSSFPTLIELNEDFGERSIILSEYESHNNPEYTGDDLKWYVTGNSDTIFRITGDNNTGTAADTFILTSISNTFGNEALTYHLHDPNGIEAIINQTVIVYPVNDPPEIKPLPDITINVNEEKMQNFEKYVHDVETVFSDLIIETDFPEQIKIDGSSLIIKFDDIGEYSVQIKVKDGELETVHTFTVFVIDPNDLDGDGMPNPWEQLYGLDPNDPEDARLDIDRDLLTNFEEYELGTDPRKIDTDDDGLDDKTDLYPNDPTRPRKESTPKGINIQIYAIFIVIILLVIITIIPIIIRKKRRSLIGEPYTQDRILNEVTYEILSDSDGQNFKLSHDKIKKKLEVSHKKGEISEGAYKYINNDILYMEDDQ